MASAAWRARILTASLVGGFVAATHALWPEPRLRAERQYLLVITLGYGHLIGAASLARRRRVRARPAGPSRLLVRVAVFVGALDLFALYAWLSIRSAAFLLALLAASLWHIVENDLALARAYRGSLALGALPLSLGHSLAALALTALLGVAGAMALRPGDSPIDFGDLFSAVTLYHLIEFLVLFAARARALGDRAARRRLGIRLASVHLPPAALCAMLLWAHAPGLAALRTAIFSPAIYLFWSLLHVAQTMAARGIEAPRGEARP
jgi:hypothetical protein